MRQVTYGQQLQQEELRRKALMDQAIRARYEQERALQGQKDAEDARLGNALLGVGEAVVGGAAKMFGG